MRKRLRSLFTVVLFFLSIISFRGICQGTSAQDKKPDLPSGEQPSRFYNLNSFTPVTFNGDFLNAIQTVCGYRIIPQLAIGGGIGYEYFRSVPTYLDFKASLSLLPVFVDVRYVALKGKVSPVLVVNAGYKFLLNRPSTQMVYDTVYSSVITVSARDDYSEYETYTGGGPFITAGIGVNARFYRQMLVNFSVEYSLWSVSGDHHTTDVSYLYGSAGWAKTGTTETVSRTLAYVHMFQVRLGIGF
jgi:hypothetical protein